MQIDYVLAELEGYAALRDPETGIQVQIFVVLDLRMLIILLIARSI